MRKRTCEGVLVVGIRGSRVACYLGPVKEGFDLGWQLSVQLEALAQVQVL